MASCARDYDVGGPRLSLAVPPFYVFTDSTEPRSHLTAMDDSNPWATPFPPLSPPYYQWQPYYADPSQYTVDLDLEEKAAHTMTIGNDSPIDLSTGFIRR